MPCYWIKTFDSMQVCPKAFDSKEKSRSGTAHIYGISVLDLQAKWHTHAADSMCCTQGLNLFIVLLCTSDTGKAQDAFTLQAILPSGTVCMRLIPSMACMVRGCDRSPRKWQVRSWPYSHPKGPTLLQRLAWQLEARLLARPCVDPHCTLALMVHMKVLWVRP